MMRVLVTGSREFDDRYVFHDALMTAYDGPERDGLEMVVVHGCCPTGADQLADEWVRWQRASFRQVLVDPFPADWDRYGKSAGPFRNQQMVDAGADLCVAFFKDGKGNRGTSDCVKRAEKAGIPVRRYRA